MKKKADRHKMIIDYLVAKESASLDELASYHNVSRMTIHRDVVDLIEIGVIRKDKGIITMQSSAIYESNFWFRSDHNKTAKQALARAALKLVGSYQHILIDDSTTALEMARAVALDEGKTIISNSVAAFDLMNGTKLNFVQIGGSLNRVYNSYLGVLSETTLRSLTADVCYISSSSLDEQYLYHQNEDVVRFKQAVMAASRFRVLAIDDSKLRSQALLRVCQLSDFDHIFCYSRQKNVTLTRMLNAGLPITVVN